ncbi:pentapeptide repeat-containing protein [Polaribacter sp. PL03]|uniref:pentapeptide repeat-containing protein n=1 Tax=Polaribacter sp. PL03 TaxID=3088353 RepID=UPI0029D273CA|nr:pentapeptide repeat-containing protein [Polaribacter sp. PL03]MDX6747199.1 pentapeptide repeat-containing protein [Polaribacter sp. PL03]
MKSIITLFTISLLFITSISFAQKKIEASNIMKDIKAGKNISIKDAIIVGTLDFTFMDDAMDKPPRKKKSSWFNWNSGNSTNQITKLIGVNISFTNCTFKDDVLAYIPNEDSGYTFTASFEEEAIFKNCNFERKAMFKYSRFERNADFSETTFRDDSTFKYAKFDKNIDFSNTLFHEIATFKYAKYNKHVSFSNATFKDSATFKYTQFNNGVSFKNTKFEEDLNIKYMKVSGEFNITNMNVAYEIDSKSTKINGKSFNKYLIDEK